MRIEDDGVEGIAAWLDADPRQHGLAADQFQCEAINEGLRHRLDGERMFDIADGMELAVDGRDGDAKAVGIHRRKLRNIVGERAVLVVHVARVGRLQNIVDRVSWLVLHGAARKFRNDVQGM